MFKLAGCEGVLTRKNMQAMKPITGIQVPSEKICATLTPIADNSSIPVSVKYTCIIFTSVKVCRCCSKPIEQACSCTNLFEVGLHAR